VSRQVVAGRLVLEDRVEPGRILVEGDRITAVEPDDSQRDGPFIAPGFVDLHVHGWGGNDAMGGVAALDGMARGLLRQGVTSFLPTGVTAPLPVMVAFAESYRAWRPNAPGNGADPLGFNLEGPFISEARKGAHNPAYIRTRVDVPMSALEPLLEGLRLTTVAPEIPGGLELIGWFEQHGVRVSMGHSAATVDEARAGYRAGGSTTTHLFNGMSGVDHRSPGLAVAALTDDDAWVELIADGQHVHPAIWDLIARAKPRDRLMLVSDAIPIAGTDIVRATLLGLEIEVRGARCTLAGTDTLAGSVIALDSGVRNLVGAGFDLPAAVRAASRNPLELLGVDDRGLLEPGLRADLVELDAMLSVQRVMRAGAWHPGSLSVASIT
jgi:N-acetylglucosamine-6-phosphate deacetylase